MDNRAIIDLNKFGIRKQRFANDNQVISTRLTNKTPSIM